MKVSVTVVTYNRENFMPAIYDVYARQDYPDTELLVMDDSDQPSEFFAGLDDPRVRYIYSPTRMSIGRKRNTLVQLARGQWICHFDDDDYYADDYISRMLAHAGTAGFVKLSAWFNLSVEPKIFSYWDTHFHDWLSCRQSGRALTPLDLPPARAQEYTRRSVYGYGFSYFYQRAIGLRYPFKDKYFGEDYPMPDAYLRDGGEIRLVKDEGGLVLHQLHRSNTSTVSPQYRLPAFLLPKLFPDYRRYARLMAGTGQPAPVAIGADLASQG